MIDALMICSMTHDIAEKSFISKTGFGFLHGQDKGHQGGPREQNDIEPEGEFYEKKL